VPSDERGAATFTVTFVEGVTLDKWRRRWHERVPTTRLDLRLVDVAAQLDAVRDGTASMAFVRDLSDDEREGLHHIPLYREVPVVVVGREHPVAAYDEIPLSDLADEIVLDDPALETRLKVETVAAGTGVVFLPMSVARVHHRKDVVAVPVDGLPESQVGLAWRSGDQDALLETFIGIVRGRTARSSRGTSPAPAPRKPAPRDRPAGRSGGRRHRR
jgi:DNA-binding transcriptional LysR family regulator